MFGRSFEVYIKHLRQKIPGVNVQPYLEVPPQKYFAFVLIR